MIRVQPEGPLNAEARIVAGDIQVAQKNFDAAAKLFESVSIVFDDDQIAPASMEKAYYAYRSGGKLKESLTVLNRLQSRYPEYAREHRLK
jgi:lipopolysaccharide biosynthesis regulator YciM